MLGHELELFGTEQGLDLQGFNRGNFDVNLNVSELSRILEPFSVVINSIAYTAVDNAENNQVLANEINGILPGKLALATESIGNRFVHFSTDYVFDGVSENPYSTSDSVAPKTAYGRSKAFGEAKILESNGNFSILRTAWLYGKYGKCFPRTIAGLLSDAGSVKVVNDQYGQPTWTRDLAELTFQEIAEFSGQKIIHAVASGRTTWFEFASAIAKSAGHNPNESVLPVTSSKFYTHAIRPKYSVLNNYRENGKVIGDWRDRWEIAAKSVLSGT